VYLLDLLQGARTSDSHVFTRIKESRNQYTVESKLADAAGMKLKPHSAKDTLDFLKKHFVKESSVGKQGERGETKISAGQTKL
jgi:hypothetical protein